MTFNNDYKNAKHAIAQLPYATQRRFEHALEKNKLAQNIKSNLFYKNSRLGKAQYQDIAKAFIEAKDMKKVVSEVSAPAPRLSLERKKSLRDISLYESEVIRALNNKLTDLENDFDSKTIAKEQLKTKISKNQVRLKEYIEYAYGEADGIDYTKDGDKTILSRLGITPNRQLNTAEKEIKKIVDTITADKLVLNKVRFDLKGIRKEHIELQHDIINQKAIIASKKRAALRYTYARPTNTDLQNAKTAMEKAKTEIKILKNAISNHNKMIAAIENRVKGNYAILRAAPLAQHKENNAASRQLNIIKKQKAVQEVKLAEWQRKLYEAERIMHYSR